MQFYILVSYSDSNHQYSYYSHSTSVINLSSTVCPLKCTTYELEIQTTALSRSGQYWRRLKAKGRIKQLRESKSIYSDSLFGFRMNATQNLIRGNTRMVRQNFLRGELLMLAFTVLQAAA